MARRGRPAADLLGSHDELAATQSRLPALRRQTSLSPHDLRHSGALRGAIGNQATTRRLTGPVQAKPLPAWRSELARDDDTTPHEHAARGVQGPGAALPHLRELQPLFGEHDLSGVRAHVGEAARSACAATGAAAYATGDRVAFADASPSLHTVAHEAAHVLQQRAGVRLSGALGRAGDAYERHADRVADAVTQRRPVAAMFPAVAAPVSGRPAVQRLMSREQLIEKAGEPKADTFGGYHHRSKLYKALLTELDGYAAWANLPIPRPGPLHTLGHDRVETALQAVKAACDAFITRFDGLTGLAAYTDSVEAGRVGEVKALRARAVQELAWLPLVHGNQDYVGMSWREALPKAEVDRRARPVRERIEGLAAGRVGIDEIRDEILGLDDIEVKQALLHDRGLWEIVGRSLDASEALILAAVLLDRALVWWDGSGPDAATGFQIKRGGDFSLWMLDNNERSEHRPDRRTGSMNCWEGVLYSMYVAGVVSYATLRDLHQRAAEAGVAAQAAGAVELEQNPELLREGIIQKRLEHQIVDTRETVEQWYEEKIKDNPKMQANYKANLARTLGNDAYYFQLAESLGAHGARQWHPGDAPPPAGDVVFFAGDSVDKVGEKWRIAHVCISLGRRSAHGTDIMNFGVASGGHTIWGCTTIEEGLAHKYSKGYKVMYGPSPLLGAV